VTFAGIGTLESFSMTSLQRARIFVAWAPGLWLRAHEPGAHAAFGCGFAALGIVPKQIPIFCGTRLRRVSVVGGSARGVCDRFRIDALESRLQADCM
jgi:hypothetical protein